MTRRAALLLPLAALLARAEGGSRPLDRYAVSRWGTAAGLPQNSVTAIARDRDGRLWLATGEGIARWDGDGFAVIDRAAAPALHSVSFHALALAPDGAVWAGNDLGQLLRAPARGEPEVIAPEALRGARVNALAFDRDGALWVGADAGLWRGDGTRFAPESLPFGGAVLALRAEGGALWAGGARGLARRRDGAWTALAPGYPVEALAAERDGALLAGGELGVARFTADGAREILYDGAGVHALLRDAAGALWIGTDGRGLCRLAAGALECLAEADGAPLQFVLSLHEDGDGNLWVGADAAGLVRLRAGPFRRLGRREGLGAPLVRVVAEAAGGGLWIGTSGGGLFREKDGALRAWTRRDGLYADNVWALAEEDGGLWIGTTGGLNRLAPDGRLERRLGPEKIPGGAVRALALQAGTVWIGTDHGLAALAPDGGLLLPSGEGGLPDASVRVLLADPDGTLWAGGNGGLFAGRGGRFTPVALPADPEARIVRSLLRDADGTLWIGTNGGGLLRLRGGRLARATSAQGLLHDALFVILDDGRGGLWFTGNRGLFRVARAQLEALLDGRAARVESRAFGPADGLLETECNGGSQPAGWRARDGRLWFPTVAGLVSVDPAALRDSARPPPARIEALVVDGETRDAGRPLSLPPGRHSVEIRYGSVELTDPAGVHYRYRLEGGDGTWVDAGRRRAISYANPPPGVHRFQVAAAIRGGAWGEPAAVEFAVRPALHQRAGFWGLVALAALAAGGVYYLLRVTGLQRRTAELEATVAARTAELAAANARLTALSERDALTGLHNRRRFDALLEAEWKRARRTAEPLALLLIDIDRFKRFNDARGHAAGDDCLREVAAVLGAGAQRAGDICARWGGEEFTVLLPGADRNAALAIGERIRATVESQGIVHPEGGRVTVSVGAAAIVPTENDAPAALFTAADRALYAAKQAGRNRVEGA